MLTVFAEQHADCIGVKLEGPFKPKNTRSTSWRNSSMSKWRHCTFLHSVRSSPSPLRLKPITQVSRLKALSKSGHYRYRAVRVCRKTRVYLRERAVRSCLLQVDFRHQPSFLLDVVFLHETGAAAALFVEELKETLGLQARSECSVECVVAANGDYAGVRPARTISAKNVSICSVQVEFLLFCCDLGVSRSRNFFRN